ncbi:hypothetical protein F5Y18DRAFT_432916 [Xylariaceae sp. FL1019]|nr:hypothetical protein F5Y18DRAFT_432916 [Xylariaceae sp. FL1019]
MAAHRLGQQLSPSSSPPTFLASPTLLFAVAPRLFSETMGSSTCMQSLSPRVYSKSPEVDLQEEQQLYERSRRSEAPEPEPVPYTMSRDQDASRQGLPVSWERYAHSPNMAAFGSLEDSDPSQQRLTPIWEEDNILASAPKAPRAMLRKNVPFVPVTTVTAPKRKTRGSRTWNNPLLKNSPQGPMAPFGDPSPVRPGARAPLLLRNEPTMSLEPAKRSLEDLYRDHPDIPKPNGTLNTEAMTLVHTAILQLVHRALLEWMEKWCPEMTTPEVLRDTRAGRFKFPTSVPGEALDPTRMGGTFHEMLEICFRTEGTINHRKLVTTVDHCITFCGAIKDDEHKESLEKTRLNINWWPVALDVKKLVLFEKANEDLRDLEVQRDLIETSNEEDRRAHEEVRMEMERAILSLVEVQFNVWREKTRIDMLDTCKTLMDRTEE